MLCAHPKRQRRGTGRAIPSGLAGLGHRARHQGRERDADRGLARPGWARAAVRSYQRTKHCLKTRFSKYVAASGRPATCRTLLMCWLTLKARSRGRCSISRPAWISAARRGLKHVLALPGQSVCRVERTVTVDGTAVGDALDRDRQGRDLPDWQGCRIVAHGEMFLMNWRSDISFDTRYFGPLPPSTIIGHATPLWIRQDN